MIGSETDWTDIFPIALPGVDGKFPLLCSRQQEVIGDQIPQKHSGGESGEEEHDEPSE